MSPQLEPVAEHESLKTHVDHSGSRNSATLGHLHQSGEESTITRSPRRENEQQGDHSHHKKSLFSKMKDKAKKLQHSLSNKKRHDEEGDATMSPFGNRSDDHTTLSPREKSKDHKVREEPEEEEEAPEYLGAPMYESKKAPEELKEAARQHPRETPVITETNLLSVLPAKDCNTDNPVISEKNVLLDVKQEKTGKEPNSPSKTVTETVTEKLAPAYAKVSDATNAITKKIQDLAFPESTEPQAETNDVSGTNQTSGLNTKVWDKGVSMKEYIAQKFEPGEDDKALSRVITKAISPRKASSQDAQNSAENKAPLLANNTNEIVEEENHGKILQPN